MDQFHAAETKDELLSVVSRMCKLGDDEEPEVRAELLFSLPNIALFCKDHSEDLSAVVRQQVVPYVAMLLTDDQLMIRKLGHASLKILVENKMLDDSQLKDWICPLLSQLVLSKSHPDELRFEDVSAMCKVVLHIDKEVSEQFFLSPFLSLCCDSSFCIRKACAMNFKSFCEVMDLETIERRLLPAFFNLCNDETWCVRKECANVFCSIAKAVSFNVKEILCDYFICFIQDTSHHVKFAAYEALGEFICTFKCSDQENKETNSWKNINECLDHLNIDNNNEVEQNQYPDFEKTPSLATMELHSKNSSQNSESNINSENQNESKYIKNMHNKEIVLRKGVDRNNSLLDMSDSNVNPYNTFQFWRTPLPDVESDVHIESFTSQNSTSSNKQSNSPSNSESNKNIKVRRSTAADQNIVPFHLLEIFIKGMKNTDLTSILAYNFCAVAHTLGKKHWSIIKHVFLALASNPNESVRATVASFLHELADILGHELTLLDILPVALTLSNDVDSVRVKFLIYLSRFLRHLNIVERGLLLPFIKELQECDRKRNWRFRFTAVEQLFSCVYLFELSEVDSHFLPLSLAFINDRASAVRKSAIKLLCLILKLFLQEPDYKNKALLLLEEVEALTWAYTWLERQKCVYICEELAEARSLSAELYSEKIVPILYFLAKDRIPNVRLAAARCLKSISQIDYLSSICNSHTNEWMHTIYALTSDKDRDVKFLVRDLTCNRRKDSL